MYQLLPRDRHRLFVDADGGVDLDLFDPEVWERNSWGLMDPGGEPYLAWLLPDVPEEQRRALALDYTAWCLRRAEQLHAALDQKPENESRSQIYLFASDSQDTLLRGSLIEDDGRLLPTFDEAALQGHGDGTVARYSAVADERFGGPWNTWLDSPIPWTNVTFLADDHIGLTRNPHFVNNLLFLLLETRPPVR